MVLRYSRRRRDLLGKFYMLAMYTHFPLVLLTFLVSLEARKNPRTKQNSDILASNYRQEEQDPCCVLNVNLALVHETLRHCATVSHLPIAYNTNIKNGSSKSRRSADMRSASM